MLRNAMEVSNFQRYEDVRFNVISVTGEWVGVKFPEKKCYVMDPNLDCGIGFSVHVQFQLHLAGSRIRNAVL